LLFESRGAQRASAETTGTIVGAILTSLVTTLVVASPVAATTPSQGPTDPGLPRETATATARPFPAPHTTRTIRISTAIDATGATNVGPALHRAIAAAPNGSVISFPAGAVFRIDGKLDIGARRDLVLLGNGSTLRIGASGASRSNTVIDIWGGSTDIAIRGFKLVGNSPMPGALIDGQEFAMGVNVDIASRVEIANVTISSVYGDGLTVDNWANGIWFHDSHVVSAGRSGVALLAARSVIVEHDTFDHVGLHGFNIEPFRSSGGAIGAWFRENTLGTYGTKGSAAGKWAVFFTAHGVSGATITNVRVSRNTVAHRSIQTQVTSTTRRRSIAVVNNRSLVAQAPYYNSPAVLWFAHVDGLTVYGNRQPLSDGSLVDITDCTNVDRG
jgi:hypothetical protein